MKSQKFELKSLTNKQFKRYPNLNTVLMIEKSLKEHKDKPLKVAEIKKELPKKIMHSTLIIALEYLWESGKIIYGPKGIQWIYSQPEHLKKMLNGAREV